VSSGARDWKKSEKSLYLPAGEPCRIDVPAFTFFAIRGRGDPNGAAFQDYVGVLYSLAYAVRMSYKWDEPPAGYETYAVYPLEGVWDVSDEVKASGPGVRGPLDKDSLVFRLMIRQPEFVTPELAERAMETVRRKKPSPLLGSAVFATLEEGPCVQMLHRGSYDDEPASFSRMEEFCASEGLTRKSLTHREIYISDPRRVDASAMKTVLRFQVEPKGR